MMEITDMKLKYVVFDCLFPVIFTEAQQHVKFKFMGKITSAGFCKIYSEGDVAAQVVKVHCYGESISLNIKSDPKDSELLTRVIRNEY